MAIINKKKSISSRLMLLLVGAVIVFFVGCDSKASKNNGETNLSDSPNDENAETTTGSTKYFADYLPDKTYGGYEFRIVAPEDGMYDMVTAVNVEKETGDTIRDAIYKRNRTIEDRYDIRFKQINATNWASLAGTFKKSTLADSDDFDLCMMISREAWASALTGMVVSVDKLPYLDISQPWYAHDVNNEITINNKLYFAYSDECIVMFESTMCVLFNKKIVGDFALDDMYSLVKKNKWTIDKFFSLAKAVSADLDGDGEMTDTDRYGILSQFDSLYPCFWVSSGIKTVSKDENDLLVFTGDGEKLYSVLDNLYQNLFGGEKIFFDTWNDKGKIKKYPFGMVDDDQRRVSIMQFEDNLGLFFVTGVGGIPALRAMETDFGILPFPKYDEAQQIYYSRVIDGWINCVSNTARDLERTSIIMEALAVESKNITMPAYFETALLTKYARDDESQEMLDIIYAHRTMDMGDTFYMGAVRDIYMGLLNSKKNNFASAVEKATNSINKTLQKANEAVLALD